MWLTYQQATTFHCLPSQLFGLAPGSYAAYCFDEAVHYYGSWLTGELENIEGKNAQDIERKRTRFLENALGVTPTAKRFADPADLFAKK